MLFVLAAAIARADGKVAESEVPKAAMKAVLGVVPDAKFISGDVGDENHRTVYKLRVKSKDGAVLHVRVTPDGTVTRLDRGFPGENDVTMDQVPQAVKDAVAKLRPNAKILEVSIGTHDDRLVYEVLIGEGEPVYELYVTEKGEVTKVDKKFFIHHALQGDQR
jgi:uncharacterized membrane protein YkoI